MGIEDKCWEDFNNQKYCRNTDITCPYLSRDHTLNFWWKKGPVQYRACIKGKIELPCRGIIDGDAYCSLGEENLCKFLDESRKIKLLQDDGMMVEYFGCSNMD